MYFYSSRLHQHPANLPKCLVLIKNLTLSRQVNADAKQKNSFLIHMFNRSSHMLLLNGEFNKKEGEELDCAGLTTIKGKNLCLV